MNATISDTPDPQQAATAEFGRFLHAQAGSATRAKRAVYAGRILSGLAVLFVILDAGIKILGLPAAVEATTQLGYPASTVFGIGIVELLCLAVYLIPRTALIGAIVWTGYLGGAVASNVRAANPLFSHTLFPIYFAALLWIGLGLRDRRVDALLASPD
jgi:hypothetical protein